MPDEPNAALDKVAPGGIVQLHDAPAGLDDASFDSLFPAEPTLQTQTTPQTQPNQQQVQADPNAQTPPVTPVTQTQDFFLKGERSVYKTSEAAVEGLNQKDALIEQLRQRYALTTGIDPITGQPVTQQQVAQAQQPNDYMHNPDLYMSDLLNAAKSGKPEEYQNVQKRFIKEALREFAPSLQTSAVNDAKQTVAKELPAISQFIGTDAYSKTLDAFPKLKDAIASSESNPDFTSQLPELYKLAYMVSQGMSLPNIVRAQQTVVPAQTQNQQTNVVRTTTSQTTLPPPQQTARPTLRTLQGIRSTIADAESRGVSLEF